jgi:hypothetical protein
MGSIFLWESLEKNWKCGQNKLKLLASKAKEFLSRKTMKL